MDASIQGKPNPDYVTSMHNVMVKSFSPYMIYKTKDPTSQTNIQFEIPRTLKESNTRMLTKDYTIYFEVQVEEMRGEEPVIGIGLSPLGMTYGPTAKTSTGMVGWFFNSIGYHSDDGYIIDGNLDEFVKNLPEKKAPQYGKGDIVGCSWNTVTGDVFFTWNGKKVDQITGCKNLWSRKYDTTKHPFVACVTALEYAEFSVNMGLDVVNRPFKFTEYNVCKELAWRGNLDWGKNFDTVIMTTQ